jgi:hypothetical protein
MGLINTFTETKAFIFLTSLMRASIFSERPKQTRRRWNYPPTDTVQTAGLRPIGKTFDADATLLFRFEHTPYTGNVWHPSFG